MEMIAIDTDTGFLSDNSFRSEKRLQVHTADYGSIYFIQSVCINVL